GKKTGREREREVGKGVSIGETGVHREGGRERRGKECVQGEEDGEGERERSWERSQYRRDRCT
ncbi:hypothetical protein GBAR_LOCUS5309, partial [Geodia barretti]